MGVRQDYYADFAAWLARQGYVALTLDYRGMGASRPHDKRRSLRGFDADLFDWADDIDAAIEHLIGEGISINITLLFSQEVYREVAEAYIAGLEEYVADGKAGL